MYVLSISLHYRPSTTLPGLGRVFLHALPLSTMSTHPLCGHPTIHSLATVHSAPLPAARHRGGTVVGAAAERGERLGRDTFPHTPSRAQHHSSRLPSTVQPLLYMRYYPAVHPGPCIVPRVMHCACNRSMIAVGARVRERNSRTVV